MSNNKGKGGNAKTAAKTTVDKVHDNEVAQRFSRHICESPNCQSADKRIRNAEILTTVSVAPRRKHYYHKSCPR